MALAHDHLPDDAQALKQLLIGREALIGRLIEEITRLKRWRFGRSAEKIGETICPQLPFEELPTPKRALVAEGEMLPAQDSTGSLPKSRIGSAEARRASRALPPELPRQIVRHEPARCQCPECGSALRRLGEDVSEMLDFVPGCVVCLRSQSVTSKRSTLRW